METPLPAGEGGERRSEPGERGPAYASSPSTTPPVHVGQPIVAAAVAICQTLVIQPHQVQDRGVEIVYVYRIVATPHAVFVRLAVDDPPFYPPPASHELNAQL